jgi:ATP-dependent helicase/nuclease subunit A
VILPHLDRRFRYDSEPFIDDVLGISLSPTDPENGYQQSEPTATQLMQNRAKQRTDAEEKRLFYVAATRARDRLVLSGTLDWRGNAGGWFGWLLATLGFSGMPHVTRDLDSIGEDEIQHPVTIEALSGAGTTPISFDLPIRIIKSLDALDFVEEDTPAPPPPAGFPAFHVDSLRPSPVSETFSVTQLATYAHCPTKFYLQHRIQAPISDLDPESTARGTAVHEVLAQLRTQADCDRDLEPLIRAMFVDVSVETVREHVENFLNSEIGVMALSADERYCERHIYAQIGSHLINGIVDRLFKDSAGLWHLIDYKTDAIDRSELADSVARYRPQIELYALLVHRLHPPQVVIPATIFFTHLAEPYSMELTGEALEEVEGAWLKRIEAIQVGTFEKNAEHCPMCPYFVDSQCLVSN